MPWVTRGLADGVVTTRYPARPDDYGSGFRAAVTVHGTLPADASDAVARLCPTDAIRVTGGAPVVDRDRCVLCGRCVEALPEVFSFNSALETAHRPAPLEAKHDGPLASTRTALAARTRALRRSIYVRHVDTGSDGSDEWEVAALTGPIYDVQRLGVYFTASPRHADLLLVTGAGSAAMAEPLRRTYDAMPAPKVVVAVGADAATGGPLRASYVGTIGVSELIPVDVVVPGSPPSPFSILHGILLAVGLLDPGSTSEDARP